MFCPSASGCKYQSTTSSRMRGDDESIRCVKAAVWSLSLLIRLLIILIIEAYTNTWTDPPSISYSFSSLVPDQSNVAQACPSQYVDTLKRDVTMLFFAFQIMSVLLCFSVRMEHNWPLPSAVTSTLSTVTSYAGHSEAQKHHAANLTSIVVCHHCHDATHVNAFTSPILCVTAATALVVVAVEAGSPIRRISTPAR